ncbi:MAG: pilus assembly protein [Hyphomicrobiaceae bacterium]
MIRSLFARFGQDRSGVAFIIFALMAGVLIPLVGGALDYGRALTVRERLATAADAAALALTSAGITDQARARTFTRAFLDANYPKITRSIEKVDINIPELTTEQARVEIRANVKANFLTLIGIDKLPVTVIAATTGPPNIEVVMVLDNTVSMLHPAQPNEPGDECPTQASSQDQEPIRFEDTCLGKKSKIVALKTAARDLTTELFKAASGSNSVKIGLVPFSSSVNVGAARQADWLDRTGISEMHREFVDFTNKNGGTVHSVDGKEVTIDNLIDLFSLGLKTDWRGCVRALPYPDDELLSPSSSWVPMFAPDEEGPGNREKFKYGDDRKLVRTINDYLPDPEDGNLRNIDRYLGGIPFRLARGPHGGCSLTAIQPLTNASNVVQDAITKMKTGGQTAIPQGLVWGWRVASPNFEFTTDPNSEPSADHVARSATTDRAIILLTDGENNVTGLPFSAYGIEQPTNKELDDKTARVCSNVKESKDNITLFTITFGTISDAAAAIADARAKLDDIDARIDEASRAKIKAEREAEDPNATDEQKQASKDAAASVDALNQELLAAEAKLEAANSKATQSDKNAASVIDLMKGCASVCRNGGTDGKCYYHAPTGDQLNSVFKNIAGLLRNLRLVR